jgi:hypothetical protein
MQSMSVKHLCTSRASGREIDQANMPMPSKKITSAIMKTHNSTARQEINEHIFGTIKRQWGYNHTNLTGLEK